MPVTHVNIEWPDHKTDQIYSPSSVIEEYFEVGAILTISDFLAKCNAGLSEASERVRLKFGYACTSAQAETFRIKDRCDAFKATENVKILSIK
jgi:uncharacterized repeat protein (TIGR04042 family)